MLIHHITILLGWCSRFGSPAALPHIQTTQDVQSTNIKTKIDTPSHQLVRRDAAETRSARVTYHCPVGGLHSRTFEWHAHYDAADNHVTMLRMDNIESFEHVDKSANFFSVWFRGHHSATYETKCCTYQYRGHIFGGIFGSKMSTYMTSSKDYPPNDMQILEYCIEVSPHPTCPVGTGFGTFKMGNCQVKSVVQGKATPGFIGRHGMRSV